MGQTRFFGRIRKFCAGMLLAVCLARLAALPALAAGGGAQADLPDGSYTVEVVLEGGSGRASVLSPALLTVREGKAYAQIEWNSSNYDYMKVGEERFKPLPEKENSTFEIPVAAFDTPLTVIGDTIAMSTPHEVEYTLTFVSDSIAQEGGSSRKVAFIGLAAAVLLFLFLYTLKKRSRTP